MCGSVLADYFVVSEQIGEGAMETAITCATVVIVGGIICVTIVIIALIRAIGNK